MMRTRARRCLRLLLLALSVGRSSALLVRISRRAAVAGGAAALATACQPRPAAARRSSSSNDAPTSSSSYDSIPVDTGPDLDALAALEARSRLRKEREALAAKKNAQVQQLTRVVGQATSSAEYNDAMAALTVWIIGSGPPIPIESMGLGPATTAPLPEGFRTRELISTCKEALDDLPRVRQEAGAFMVGTGSMCEKSRMGSYCLSAGPLAESAFKAMLDELRQRAPRQYDTNSGRVAF